MRLGQVDIQAPDKRTKESPSASDLSIPGDGTWHLYFVSRNFGARYRDEGWGFVQLVTAV